MPAQLRAARSELGWGTHEVRETEQGGVAGQVTTVHDELPTGGYAQSALGTT